MPVPGISHLFSLTLMTFYSRQSAARVGKNGDEEKRALYKGCLEAGPSAHPWKAASAPMDSSSLLDQVQNKPSVEPALRKYQRRRLQEQEQRNPVYIPPQAKATREAPDDDLFDLTTRGQRVPV